MAEQATELKGVIFDIQENYEEAWIPPSGPNAGKELFKHKVILLDSNKNKIEGVFFQRTKKLTFNKENCFVNQEICYTSRPPAKADKPPVFTMCSEKDSQSHSPESSKEDLSKATSMGFSYAKDVVNACYEGQGKTLEEYVKAIKDTATDFKKFLLEIN
jgi:hypothetical protein